MFKITFTFIDGHRLDVEVQEDMLDKFLDDLGQNKTFFNKDKTSGFWLQGEKIRYFELQKIGES